jgi:hypothetical protein
MITLAEKRKRTYLISEEEMTERKRWRMKRLEKEIELREIAPHLQCSYNLLSMYERGKAPMVAEKIKLYREYIEKH